MLILASASPRRRELLALITPHFRVVASETEECIACGWTPYDTVSILSKQKAEAVYAGESGIVIGADTIVVLDNKILGKPRDTQEAFAMLRCLSGRTHVVHTGVSIVDHTGCDTFVVSTEVSFRPLEETQIHAYIATGAPMDKAGAYGIQDKGALFIQRICGDYYAVMGLPVCKLSEKLAGKHNFAL